jgi:antibiotic biosynthesis monooxygenase (ABM) superfamily enzyme
MNQQAKIIEVVINKVKPGYSREEVIDAAQALSQLIQHYPGFISRTLSVAESSQEWVDIVHWTDLESAHRAAEAVMKDEACLKLFSMIDERDMKMLHLQPVHVFPAKQEIES